MKYTRLTWYSLTVIFFFAGLGTGRREFFLLFFIMAFVVLYALALNLWTIFSFSFIQELSQQSAVKGSTVFLKTGIYNDKPFPFTMMRILAETVTPDGVYELRFNLSPKSSIDFIIPVSCPYRGIYNVGMTKLETNDVLGLTKTSFNIRGLPYYRQRTIKILPKVVELPYLPTRNTDAKFSGAALNLSEDGENFADLRRHRPGDPFKRIHKPVSAKKQELYVRTYDIPLETAVLIAIDPSMDLGEGEYSRYMADLACQCVTAIADISLRSGFTVEFAGIDLSRSLRRKNKREILTALCDTLAELPFDKQGDFDSMLGSAITGSGGFRAAYIISASSPEVYAGHLLRLYREGCHVCCLRIASADGSTDGDDLIRGIHCIPVKFGDDIRTVLTGGQV